MAGNENGGEDWRGRRRKRSIAIALVLAVIVAMFFAATLVQFGKLVGGS